jgi:hypothetical protein
MEVSETRKDEWEETDVSTDYFFSIGDSESDPHKYFYFRYAVFSPRELNYFSAVFCGILERNLILISSQEIPMR